MRSGYPADPGASYSCGREKKAAEQKIDFLRMIRESADPPRLPPPPAVWPPPPPPSSAPWQRPSWPPASPPSSAPSPGSQPQWGTASARHALLAPEPSSRSRITALTGHARTRRIRQPSLLIGIRPPRPTLPWSRNVYPHRPIDLRQSIGSQTTGLLLYEGLKVKVAAPDSGSIEE